MKRSTLIILKTLTWIACLSVAAWLAWGMVTNDLGPDPSAAIAFATGKTTIWLLAITLAITPLRRLSPRLNWLISFRRLLRALRLFLRFAAYAHVRGALFRIQPGRYGSPTSPGAALSPWESPLICCCCLSR